ncbi:uncharacterized protein EV422DRAFT_535616 [Fimicolochytrium jonesii]|uniref:uncharacterized protein n=1 Tax=Fimicolochytrium jonesii TaxID=1396493 RepID=UPI0022FE057C|nr:uncharacterized protein EV422DRAFT_535616 [Fimicolochytrium jonesii]KAI8819222.1 hypothetical protein EV422DRAFT_535616 [Fimicolochytrium jonesii]
MSVAEPFPAIDGSHGFTFTYEEPQSNVRSLHRKAEKREAFPPFGYDPYKDPAVLRWLARPGVQKLAVATPRLCSSCAKAMTSRCVQCNALFHADCRVPNSLMPTLASVLILHHGLSVATLDILKSLLMSSGAVIAVDALDLDSTELTSDALETRTAVLLVGQLLEPFRRRKKPTNGKQRAAWQAVLHRAIAHERIGLVCTPDNFPSAFKPVGMQEASAPGWGAASKVSASTSTAASQSRPHPILQNVRRIGTENYVFFAKGTAAKGSRVIARWGTGVPLAAVNENVVSLNMIATPRVEIDGKWHAYWDPAESDAGGLVVNALRYAAAAAVVKGYSALCDGCLEEALKAASASEGDGQTTAAEVQPHREPHQHFRTVKEHVAELEDREDMDFMRLRNRFRTKYWKEFAQTASLPIHVPTHAHKTHICAFSKAETVDRYQRLVSTPHRAAEHGGLATTGPDEEAGTDRRRNRRTRVRSAPHVTMKSRGQGWLPVISTDTADRLREERKAAESVHYDREKPTFMVLPANLYGPHHYFETPRPKTQGSFEKPSPTEHTKIPYLPSTPLHLPTRPRKPRVTLTTTSIPQIPTTPIPQPQHRKHPSRRLMRQPARTSFPAASQETGESPVKRARPEGAGKGARQPVVSETRRDEDDEDEGGDGDDTDSFGGFEEDGEEAEESVGVDVTMEEGEVGERKEEGELERQVVKEADSTPAISTNRTTSERPVLRTSATKEKNSAKSKPTLAHVNRQPPTKPPNVDASKVKTSIPIPPAKTYLAKVSTTIKPPRKPVMMNSKAKPSTGGRVKPSRVFTQPTPSKPSTTTATTKSAHIVTQRNPPPEQEDVTRPVQDALSRHPLLNNNNGHASSRVPHINDISRPLISKQPVGWREATLQLYERHGGEEGEEEWWW